MDLLSNQCGRLVLAFESMHSRDEQMDDVDSKTPSMKSRVQVEAHNRNEEAANSSEPLNLRYRHHCSPHCFRYCHFLERMLLVAAASSLDPVGCLPQR
ncbi:hypothetical protein Nepgr_011146 [Nepenthes gracilis]|uniref:Uncharacterized protein n=1 Tax=Nepenthes gracilis TaxID=150966 RepID=A0AAD3SDJ3_NEPGR|nr:hypothetical protein Nepgr_011146 [Nepenthes gracilis]